MLGCRELVAHEYAGAELVCHSRYRWVSSCMLMGFNKVVIGRYQSSADVSLHPCV